MLGTPFELGESLPGPSIRTMGFSPSRRALLPAIQKAGASTSRLSPLTAFIGGNVFLALLMYAFGVGWNLPSQLWTGNGYVTLHLGVPRRQVLPLSPPTHTDTTYA